MCVRSRSAWTFPSFDSSGCLRRGALLALAQHLAVHLAGWRLGQFGHEFDEAGVLVLTEALPHEVLDLARKGLVARATGDNEGFHHLPPQGIRHADGRRLAHVGMLQDRVLDLDGAHRPTGRDDDVVGPAAVIEIAFLVRPPEILGRDPAVAPPDLELPRHAGWARLAGRIVDLDLAARHGLAQRSRL